MRQIARVQGWPRLEKYDIISNWQRCSMTKLTGQNQFTRSLSGGYKWRMAVVYTNYSLRMEEAIKESVVRGREQQVDGNSQSMNTSSLNGDDE